MQLEGLKAPLAITYPCSNVSTTPWWLPVLMQLVATASDNTVRVWAMPSGAPLHILEGHKQTAHVLECHPTDPRIAMSAGYDGQVILWDIEQGVQLSR